MVNNRPKQVAVLMVFPLGLPSHHLLLSTFTMKRTYMHKSALSLLLLLLVTVSALECCADAANSTYFYVSSTTGSEKATGMSPEDPLLTLQVAINYADTGDTIIMDSGRYTGADNCGVSITKAITITANLTDSKRVLLDCQGYDRVMTIRGKPLVLRILGNKTVLRRSWVDPSLAVSAHLVRLTMMGGRTTGRGAGVLINAAHPTFTDCVFYNNTAQVGGAIFADTFSSVRVLDSSFINNTASTGGPSVYSQASFTLLRNIVDRGASGSTHAYVFLTTGEYKQVHDTLAHPKTDFLIDNLDMREAFTGFLNVMSGEGSVNNVIVEDVRSPAVASGVSVSAGVQLFNISNSVFRRVYSVGLRVLAFEAGILVNNVTIEACVTIGQTMLVNPGFSLQPSVITGLVMRNNVAVLMAAAMGIEGTGPAGLLIQDSLFEDNDSQNYGGAISFRAGSPGGLMEFRNNVFRRNRSNVRGGAIDVDDVSILFVNVTFESNHSPLGGAVHMTSQSFSDSINEERSAAFVNCAFIGNTASEGGGIANKGMVAIIDDDTVFEGNTAELGGGVSVRLPHAQMRMSAPRFKNNAGTIAGGAMFFASGYVDYPSTCNCKGNTAGYGDEFATGAVAFNLDLSSKYEHVRTVHDTVRAEVEVVDAFGQPLSGQDIVFFGQVSGNAYLVDAKSRYNGDPLMSTTSRTGNATLTFSIAGDLGEKYDVLFSTNQFTEFKAQGFTTHIHECEDDEYEQHYPPGVGQYVICEYISYEDRTDGMYITAWVFGTLAGIGLLVAALSFPILFIFRKRNVIRYGSPIFLYIILIGVTIGYAAIFPWIVVPTDAACILRPILILLAFGQCLAPLIVKNLRVYAYYSNKGMEEVRITTWLLLSGVGVVMLIEIGIIILWMAWATPYQSWLYDDDTDDTRLKYCAGDHLTTMLIISAGFNGLLIVFALLLALKMSDVAEAFNESRWIMVIAYFVAFACVLIFPMAVISDDPTLVNVLVLTGILVCTSIVYVCLFGNRFRELIRGDDKKPSSNPNTSEGTARANKTMNTGTIMCDIMVE